MQHLQPNTTLQSGKYRIEKHLASGGFGNTYEAMNVEFEERVAIKEFFIKDTMERDETTSAVSVSHADQFATFQEQKEKFKKEARRLRKLHNEHIVRVYDLFEENGTAYYVMDYIDGEDLSKRMKRIGRAMSEHEVVEILPMILDALSSVHAEGLWHLDLKPGNIMLDKKGNVKLIDFGASKQLNVQTGGAYETSNVASTDRYAPLEQAEKSYDKIGPWTDIYSLGATLYSLLTYSTPPSASDINDDADEAFAKLSGVNKTLRDLIVWMMNTNRKKRPQSIDEVMKYVSLNLKSGSSTDKAQASSKQSTSYREEETTTSSSKQPSGEETIIDTGNRRRKDADEKTKLQEEYNQYYNTTSVNKTNGQSSSNRSSVSSGVSTHDSSNDEDNSTKVVTCSVLICVVFVIGIFIASLSDNSDNSTRDSSTQYVNPTTTTNVKNNVYKNEGRNKDVETNTPTENVETQAKYNESSSKQENYESGYIKQEGGYTNIRATPSGEIVMKIQDGSPILYSKTNSSWYVVYNTSGERLGYVHYSKIVAEGSGNSVSSNLKSGYIKQEGGYTNIRSTPSGEIVMKIQDGSPILYSKTNSSWYVVYNTSGERLGYVHYSKIVE